MRRELELLIELQALDKRCRDLDRMRQRHPEQVAQKRRDLDAKKQAVEEKKKTALQLRKEIDNHDLNLKEIEDKIQKLRAQLNTVKTNKEYSAILSQIGAEEADKSRLEDQILELMSKLDEVQREVQAAQQAFEKEQAAFQESLRELEEQQRAAESQMAELKAQRERIRAQVPAEWIEPYERLLHKRDGIALTKAVRHVLEARSAEDSEMWVCQGCYINLTMQTIASLLTGEKPVFCKSCGRMLYLEGQPEQLTAREKD